MRNWLPAGVAAISLLISASANAVAVGTAGSLAAMDTRVNPFYGPINPFYGQINPFYGNISPFWGDITPFWGDISPFWGDITPFYGDIHPFWGKINPFYGQINPFWGTVQPFWQEMGPEWAAINDTWNQLQADSATDYSGLQTQLQNFLGASETFWGARVQGATGQNFMDGFAAQVLSRYGINPADAGSLANVSFRDRSAFFLAWYDGLMEFTGVDHVDWWMGAVNWSPMLTQIQDFDTSKDVIVGLLDSAPSRLDPSLDHLKIVGGLKDYTNGHGAAVSSLIAAQHDGKGVMGIAPGTRVYLYNPFDMTGSAGFDDVEAGINALYAKGAHVVNLSLGEPGSVMSSDWALVFNELLMNPANILFVKAAGNEGVTQTANVSGFDLSVPQNLILVGSVGPTGEISAFSNRPGEACITVLGLCLEENKLKYRFIVAPGELMLVSDNNGGVTRMSGTSFAAPLVTGAIALLYSRWPWLQEHSAETVQIILQSADDLGEPGVDGTYGWGMLNVEASQSPLDFDDLVVYRPTTYRKNADFKTILNLPWSTSALKAAVLNPGQLDLWKAQNAFIVAFENIGLTHRDFTIPLSSTILNKNQQVNGVENRFQSYLYQRMVDWANGTGFSDFASQSVQVSGGEWNFSMMATAASRGEIARGAEMPFHSEFVAVNPAAGVALRFGEGDGAYALSNRSFAMRSDFDPATGGVNPVLGFASGGVYGESEFAIGERMHVSFGFSHESDDHTFVDPRYGALKATPLPAYEATAAVVGLDYDMGDGVTLNTSYTRLNEADGLFGAQGAGALGFSGGSNTDALTFGANVALSHGIELMASATFARTPQLRFDNSPLGISDGGLLATAWQVGALKTGLFADADRLRISFAQPLHVETGALEYRSLQVIDRNTGELGLLSQTWNIGGGERGYRAEAMYGIPVLDGQAELSGFAMFETNRQTAPDRSHALSLGAQFRMAF
jgi:subtilisin family serine protease